MTYFTNKMKRLLKSGKAVFSCTVGIPHPNLAEIAGLAGYECVMLDGEHGSISTESLDPMILAVRATGSTLIFRAPAIDKMPVKQALDHGVGAFCFPIFEPPKMREWPFSSASTLQSESEVSGRKTHPIWPAGSAQLSFRSG